MANGRAGKLGDACLAYRAKYHHYPQELNALVPEFIPSVPVARYGLVPDNFSYSAGKDARELEMWGPPKGEGPMLSYSEPPGEGHYYYDIERRCWRYSDIRGMGTCLPTDAHSGRF